MTATPVLLQAAPPQKTQTHYPVSAPVERLLRLWLPRRHKAKLRGQRMGLSTRGVEKCCPCLPRLGGSAAQDARCLAQPPDGVSGSPATPISHLVQGNRKGWKLMGQD